MRRVKSAFDRARRRVGLNPKAHPKDTPSGEGQQKHKAEWLVKMFPSGDERQLSQDNPQRRGSSHGQSAGDSGSVHQSKSQEAQRRRDTAQKQNTTNEARISRGGAFCAKT